MPDNRFYVEGPISSSRPVLIKGREHHHIYRVMRKWVGDRVELVNGEGDFAIATLKKITDDYAELSVEEMEKKEPSQKPFRLIQAIPNIVRLEFLLEKCTELGCTEFWFYFSAKSEHRPLSEGKIERLEYILISSLKQCGAYYLPKMLWFDKVEKITPPEGPLFFGDFRKEAPKVTSSSTPCTFINGPESGFTEQELSYFEKEWQATGISLHPNILRTETAAIAATAFFTT